MATCPRCSAGLAKASADALCDACLLEEALGEGEAAAGGETFGVYKILCRLGEGGLGVVYLAEQTEPVHREVALKAMKPGTATREAVARSERERQALALLEHPGIARMIDAGTSSAGRPYFVMEYADGAPITEFCAQRKLDQAGRLRLLVEVCRAVEYAHTRGILHRDLKPSNVLVSDGGGRPAPKVIDFGIAKIVGGTQHGQALQTEAGQLLGTPEYMSPEQADLANRDLDARTDIYSLGVMLYELLSGALPFDGGRLREAGLTEALRIIREEQPPQRVAGDLGVITATAMAKDRERRYASAAALADDVERYLRQEPIRARAPSVWRRWASVARRRKSGLAAAGIAGVAIASAVLVIANRPREFGADLKVTPLTTYNGYEIDPRLSPDGSRLAFSWNGEGDNYDVYVRPVAGGEPLRLTTDPAHDLHPVWSPDGKQLAFLRQTRDRQELLTAPAAGGAERSLGEISAQASIWQQDASIMSRGPGPAWSPDGTFLAVGDRAGNQGPDCIFLIDLRTRARRKLTSPDPAEQGDALPAFSPKGDEIAFVRTAGQRGNTDVFLAELKSGRTRQLTFDRKQITGLDWISGKRLVFTSNRVGGNMVWSISRQGGAPELAAIAGRSASRVSISNRLGLAVYTETFRNTNIWRLDLTKPGTAAERLISTTRRNDSPKYSPDGTEIVFGSDRSGTYDLWIADANGKHARQLTWFDGKAVGTPRWSPDGKQIVFDAAKDGHSAIYTIAAGGGKPQLFEQAAWDEMMPSWSRDGQFIYFDAAGLKNTPRIWKKPVNGGAPVQVTHLGGGDGVEAADGQLLYFSDGRSGVWQVRPDGSGEQKTQGLERVRHSRYFAVSGKGAYFLREDRPPFTIEFYDFATRQVAAVAAIEKNILYGTPALSVSPDGHWLVYAQVDDSGSDVMLLSGLR